MKTLRAHGFNQRPRFEQVVGYLERNEPLPLDQPDRKATSFITSHFYLDDFVQSNPRPLQHTPLQAIPEDGFSRDWLTLSYCPSISRGPRCAARRCLPSCHVKGSKCAIISTPSPPPRRPCPPTWCRRKAPGVSAFLKSKITATATTKKIRTFIGPDFFPTDKKRSRTSQ